MVKDFVYSMIEVTNIKNKALLALYDDIDKIKFVKMTLSAE